MIILLHGCYNSFHLVDALHLNAQSGVLGGDSRFTRLPNGNHPRKARPAFDVQCAVAVSVYDQAAARAAIDARRERDPVPMAAA
jgi:hypothetical protein